MLTFTASYSLCTKPPEYCVFVKMLEVHVLWVVLDLEDEYRRKCAISSGSLTNCLKKPETKGKMSFAFVLKEMKWSLGKKAMQCC